MKHKGATMEYAKARLDDLMRAYDVYYASCAYVRMPELYKAIVDMPASRFWVSDIRATAVVSAMMRGEARLEKMVDLKREMYEEIFRRVVELQKQMPAHSIAQLCAIVVEQPAPKFYLTAGSAKMMICKARKKWTEDKLKKILRGL